METIQFGSPIEGSYWIDLIDDNNNNDAANGDCGGNRGAMDNENN